MAAILVVDDDRDILQMLEALLNSSKHTVLVAENALTAMNLLHNHKVDAIISDANMPHYDGYDLIRTVRSNKKFDSVPVAMLTGRSQRQDVELALRVGVDDYILKPLDPEVFLAKVRQLLLRKTSIDDPMVDLVRLKQEAFGSICVPMRILKLSETGMVIQSLLPLDSSIPFHLSSSFFEQQGITLPMLTAVQCRVMEEQDGYEIRIDFANLEEAILTKVRNWVTQYPSPAISKKVDK